MAFSAGTFSLFSPGNPVVTGTTIASTWANSTLSDIATGLSTCVLKDGTQTITAAIPMSGFKITGLGLQTTANDAVRLEAIGTVTSTFTFDGGGGTSAGLTLTYQALGKFATVSIPQAQATSGTGSTALTSNTALPAAVRPSASTQTMMVPIDNNNAAAAPAGLLSISTAGIITINRDATATAFANGATAGTLFGVTITYFIG